MVQQYDSPIRVYKYPFELVMEAYERRFPTCEFIPQLASARVVSDVTSHGDMVRTVQRECLIHVDVPYLLKKIMGVEHIHFHQKNTLHRRARTLNIEAWNESFSSRVAITEKCLYSVHPSNSSWTCFHQAATLDVRSFFGFESTVEKLVMKQYSASVSVGKEIIEHYIEVLRNEGITEVPMYEPPARSCSPSDSHTLTCDEETTTSTLNDAIITTPSSLERRFSKPSSSNSCKHHLDSDYITRYLGQLSPLQASRLVQLRSRFLEQARGAQVPTDTTLLRFLRARDFSVERAREMLIASLAWRRLHAVDGLLTEYTLPAVVADYFPGCWHQHDTDDRPIYLLRLGQMDVKGLMKSLGEDAILQLVMHICEEGLNLAHMATVKHGKPISSWTLLVDMDGLNMRHLWRPGVKMFLRIIELVEANYPETMHRVLIVRAPRVFPLLWTLVSPFIDECTRAKFMICGEDFHSSITDFVHESVLPQFLDGTSKCDINEGGLIPKSLYNEDIDVSAPFVNKRDTGGSTVDHDHMYTCITLHRGQVHELVIAVLDCGAVICWDFDVIKSDVEFCVLHTRDLLHPASSLSSEPLSPLPAADLVAPSSSICPTPAGMTCTEVTEVTDHKDCGAGDNPAVCHKVGWRIWTNTCDTGDHHNHRSLIDKSWKEGVDYFTIESTKVYRFGDSIQGSHVTASSGTYILQWRHISAHHHHHHELMHHVTSHMSHKSRVIYCHQMLHSADYKGSMTSLNSGTSGFSSLSSQSKRAGAPSHALRHVQSSQQQQ